MIDFGVVHSVFFEYYTGLTNRRPVIMGKELSGNEGRLAEIRREMAGIGPVLFGDLSAKTHRYVKADGTVSRQRAQSIFRFAKSGGRMTRRVPADAEQAVRRMIADGKRYSVLRDEYERILTALALDGALKKTPRAAAARDGEPVGRRQRGARRGG